VGEPLYNQGRGFGLEKGKVGKRGREKEEGKV